MRVPLKDKVQIDLDPATGKVGDVASKWWEADATDRATDRAADQRIERMHKERLH